MAAPASAPEASALLRAAAELGLTVVPRGAGQLQHWAGPPVSCDLIVETRRLDRIGPVGPDDGAVTVQAGARVRDVDRVVHQAGYALGIMPPRRAWAGTIGGLIATNAAGPTRYRYGTPRDLLTGVTAVRADGEIVCGGPDLAALLAGASSQAWSRPRL